jgi:Leucine-rich repeat (LRR) protein
MRSLTLLVLVGLVTLAHAEEEDPIFCMTDGCSVNGPLTDKAKKALLAIPDHENKRISIEGNFTTADLKAIAQKLPWVTRLRLQCSDMCEKLTDLKPLAALTKLKQLSLLGMFNVKDAATLQGLTTLEDLDVNVLKLTDLGPFTKLTKLKRLDVTQLFLTDLSPLASLPALEELSLRGGDKITDWAPLGALTQLRVLSVSTLPDLKIVSKLTNLEALRVAFGEKIGDLQPIAGLTRLKSLEIERSAIKDLKPLSSLAELVKLSLQLSQQVADITPLAKLGKLEEVRLGATKVTDLSPLKPRAAALKSLQVPKELPEAQLAPIKAVNPRLFIHRY